jgi:ubiquinol-cytochrome c reductase cytochrome b subunit
MAVLSVVVLYAAAGALTYQGVTAPWSPHMTAWSGAPVPEDVVRRSSPAELQGAVVFQYKDCRNCHALEGKGGLRGPDLTEVGKRLTRNQLIDQVSNGTPGGGLMPAYGQQMPDAEMTALADFLVSLRPPHQPPAHSTGSEQP